MNCKDCFFQSGRSYLEPLEDNLPNMPDPETVGFRVLRVNDGNDSKVNMGEVIEKTKQYPHKFYNTVSGDIVDLPGPTVVTINHGWLTDKAWTKIEPIPKNLMFVRFRTNMWNLKLLDEAIAYYEGHVPIVLTFMAYHDIKSIPVEYINYYCYRQRTTNPYYAITTDAYRMVMMDYTDNKWVYSCGKIEGEKGDTHCRFCGNCLREYFATMERMQPYV